MSPEEKNQEGRREREERRNERKGGKKGRGEKRRGEERKAFFSVSGVGGDNLLQWFRAHPALGPRHCSDCEPLGPLLHFSGPKGSDLQNGNK